MMASLTRLLVATWMLGQVIEGVYVAVAHRVLSASVECAKRVHAHWMTYLRPGGLYVAHAGSKTMIINQM